MAGLTGLFHVAIKTADLDKTVRFYKQVLGCREAPRPDLGFPGAWLAVPTPAGRRSSTSMAAGRRWSATVAMPTGPGPSTTCP